MNSPQRILTTTRALVAELPLGHYLLSAIICLVLLTIHFYGLVGDSDITEGLLASDYVTLGKTNALALIIGSAIFAAAILSISFITDEFKVGNRAARFLALPLSLTERSLVMVTINWMFIPLITVLPPFVLLSAVSFAGGKSILFPSPDYFVQAIPIAWLIIVLLSSLWLLPCLVLPKRGGIAFLGVLGLLGIYLASTRPDEISAVKIPQSLSAFTDPQVVGLGPQGVLTSTVPPDHFFYNFPDEIRGLGTALAALAFFTFLSAAVVALNRKTA